MGKRYQRKVWRRFIKAREKALELAEQRGYKRSKGKKEQHEVQS